MYCFHEIIYFFLSFGLFCFFLGRKEAGLYVEEKTLWISTLQLVLCMLLHRLVRVLAHVLELLVGAASRRSSAHARQPFNVCGLHSQFSQMACPSTLISVCSGIAQLVNSPKAEIHY